MLKIKDSVNLKELEKFGFKKHDGFYAKEIWIWYDMPIRILVYTDVRRIEYHDGLMALDLEGWTETIFELTNAGLVEKERG